MSDYKAHKDVLLTALEATINKTEEYLRRDRERAYRRALEATGHTPGSVEIMVAKDRDWIDSGVEYPADEA